MIAYFDLFSGISGDMTLGAMVDLGVPLDWLQTRLSRVLKGFELKSSLVYKNHLRAVNIIVQVEDKKAPPRNYKDITALIASSSLPANVKENSLCAFKKIAQAESIIHGQDIGDIHFHELGAIDSLVDIIGSFLCVEYLGIKKTYASRIAIGSGFIRCSHGKIPVPVPAVLEILKDVPVKPSDAITEIVTPTGAAIITTLASSFGNMPQMLIKKTGYGSGKRDTGSSLPNLLRIIIGEDEQSQKKMKTLVQKETIHLVKANVDDMNPEIFGFLMETLFEHKALDVSYIPVQMKKNRPGVQMEVMCRKKDLDNIVSVILGQTTSIGVRHHECERFYLLREKAFVQTVFGKIQVKKITNPDNTIRFVPEYDVAKNLAMKKKIALKDVYTQILSDINSDVQST